MSITLAVNTLDERSNIRALFNCVAKVVDEIVVVDTGSKDGTCELARKLGARVYEIAGVSGYGAMRTLTAHLARTEWVLILDGDERMDPPDAAKLKDLAKSDHDLVWLPRQHYRTWNREICENPDIRVYPDWQGRFFRPKDIYFVRKVHEHIMGVKNELRDFNSPIIRHFGWLKTPERLAMIKNLCDRLWKEDQEYADTYTLEMKAGAAGGEEYWKVREEEEAVLSA